MLGVLCYILAAYGLSNMVVYARGPFGIFEWWRGFIHEKSESFGDLFTCMICFPTWVGIVSSIVDLLFTGFAFTPFNILIGSVAPWWLIIILDAVFTSGVVWLLDQFESACQRHNLYEDEE